MNDYGKEVILDLHECDTSKFTRRKIKGYFRALCLAIEMEPCKLTWWDDLYTPEEEKETEPHLAGTSAVQFIKTSNITIHTLEIMKRVYLNVFSCKDFDADVVESFSANWFGGKVVNKTIVRRV